MLQYLLTNTNIHTCSCSRIPAYPLQRRVNWGRHVFIDEGCVKYKGRVGGLEGEIWYMTVQLDM